MAQVAVRRRGLVLRRAPDPDTPVTPPHGAAPSVAVVIPACNEADGLEACVTRVLAQAYAALSVVVVDDRSDDDTRSIARRIAAADPRVRVDRIDDLPPGWMGKSHALWHATRGIDAEWLLFLDVDCAVQPHAVAVAVAEAHRRGVDVLTLWPRQAPGGFWEHIAIPLCGAIIALWFGARHPGDAERGAPFANGQFLLIRRDAYERIGGHRAVRSALIEDIPLAENARRAGLACWVASGRDIVSVRMYRGLGAIADGWARIYVGALRSSARIAASIVWLLVGSLLPFVLGAWWLAWGTWRMAGDATQLVPVALCAVHLVLIFVVSYGFWGFGGCRRRYLLLYPVSVVVVIAILARAWWWLMIRRSVAWRRTRYAIDRKGTII